jgi:hypothetical protein
MILRSATFTDAEKIALLHANSWRIAYSTALKPEYLALHADLDRLKLWRLRLTEPAVNQRVVILEEADMLLGFACLFLAADLQWGTLLDNLHVTGNRHRAGLGTVLMKEVRRISLLERPSIPVHLWVLKDNLNAQSFYRHLGGVYDGEDIWNPPGGGHIPRFRYVWQAPLKIGQNA